MRIIWTVIRWIFGLFFCMVSIVGLASGDIIIALFVLTIGLLFLPPVTKALFRNNKKETINHVSVSNCDENNNIKTSNNQNEENLAILFTKKINQREAEIKNLNYDPIQIQRQGIQLLESINILNSTKNHDTLIGRYDFIIKIYDDFVKASYNKRYIADIQLAIDQYKTMYYDKTLNEYELQLLIKPNTGNLKLYYCECIFNCFNGFYKEQIDQLENLKKEDAKQRRKDKIIEIGNKTIYQFDINGSNNEQFKQEIQTIKDIINELSISNTDSEPELKTKLQINNSVIINPQSSFQITLYNAEEKTIRKVVNILNNESTWNKTKELLPIFTLHDVKCKEVDEYILKYKPIYNEKLKNKISLSAEYQSATDKDKEIIIDELKNKVINSIQERADCDLKTLFDFCEIDISIDNEILKKYGFDVISKYFGLSYYKDKIVSHWERKDFEDLLKADLVITADEIDNDEILNSQTLKTLNLICNKEDGFFKRKNKAIDYINENKELLSNMGKYVATRNIFKMKPLPNEFKDLDIDAINKNWSFLKEYIKLITDTYRYSERNYADISGDNSWIKSYRIEKFEDLNPDFVCLRAREECKKKYSKSNPPKLPFHVGCNCHLRTEL